MSTRKKSRGTKSKVEAVLPVITDPDLLDECDNGVSENSDAADEQPQKQEKPRGWMTTIYENKLLILIGFLVILIIVIVGYLVLRKIDDPPIPPEGMQQKNGGGVHHPPPPQQPDVYARYSDNGHPAQPQQHNNPQYPNQHGNQYANQHGNQYANHTDYHFTPQYGNQHATQQNNPRQHANQQQNIRHTENAQQQGPATGSMFDNVVNMLNSDEPNEQKPPVLSANDQIKQRMMRDVRPTDGLDVNGMPPNANNAQPLAAKKAQNTPASRQSADNKSEFINFSESNGQVLVEDVIECDVPDCNNDVYLNNKCYSHYASDY